MNEINQQIVMKFCDAWNFLNADLFENILDIDVRYQSQTVLEVIKGETEVLSYYRIMFSAIKKNNSRVLAEYAEFNSLPCTVLTQFLPTRDTNDLFVTQGESNGLKYFYRSSVVLFSFKDEKIKEIKFCIIPRSIDIKKIENVDLRTRKIQQTINVTKS